MKMRYVTPDGHEITLIKAGSHPQAIAYGGITGFVGNPAASSATAVGVPGETLTNWNIPKMTGELTLNIDYGPEFPPVEKIASLIRRGFHPTREGTLFLDPEDGRPEYSTPVCRNGIIAPPVEVLSEASYAEMKIPLQSRIGGWLEHSSLQTGTVTVTNHGDAFLWPEIYIHGPSSIKLPSGITYTLPNLPGATLSLDPYTSHEVTLDDGTLDDAASALTSKMFLGEGIPELSSRTYTLTGDATLISRTFVLDPWG